MTMYESLKSRIAALEEEEVTVEEEERRLGEEARQTVRGMSDSAVQTKYIELGSPVTVPRNEAARA